MKTLLTTLVILCSGTCISQNVQAEEYNGMITLKGETLKDATFNGLTKLTDVKADSLNVTGAFEFSNLEVLNSATITGPTSKSKNGKFGSLTVTGPFEANDVIAKDINITGSLNAQNLKVENETTVIGGLSVDKGSLNNITITSDKITLKDTEVKGNITVKKASGLFGKTRDQVLQLEGKTTVKGNITFESGEGKVEQASDSKVEGQVTGAIEKK